MLDPALSRWKSLLEEMAKETRKSDKPESSKKKKDKWHHLRYESLTEFKLFGTKVLDWDSLMKNPEYVPVYNMLDKVGWIGLTKFSNEKASPTVAKEFYAGIVTKSNLYHGTKAWDQEDMYAFFCGKEVVVTASMLGMLLNIEGSLEYVNHKDVWLLHSILTGSKVNLAQIIINEMKRTTSKKDSVHCGFGPIITALGEISSTKMHEHKDMQVICSPLSDISQHRFVQTTVKDSQIALALESLTNVVAVISTNINQMRKSNLKYRQSTQKILGRIADKILGESLENEDQLEESGETPHEEEQLPKDSENMTSEEYDIESSEKAPSAEISETNVSEAFGEINSEEGDLTLATTEEVMAGLEPLDTILASPEEKENA
ncbi:hypothetical protein COLO4_15194 [Corchorus olitorius]|uniref:Uncharacterized protein n=1 Tax=Corchorus olitorius TaxID=93759 RepID=A0A1R3JP65_9ROSI|nr:hypothetical protein COLO4_15194 [Corchorus olitorius]